jgi:GNAT superfamily N-acetyltransferase
MSAKLTPAHDVAVSTPGQLHVRRADMTDAVPLGFFFDTALRKDYFLRRGQLQEMLAGPHHEVYAAEIERVLVGVAVTTRGTRLVNVLVHPAYRGLGIGRALLEASGATEVRVKLDMSTGDPRPFYAGLGFRSAGTAEGKHNIVWMRRPSPSAANEKRRTLAVPARRANAG